jgi:hypothetical protein
MKRRVKQNRVEQAKEDRKREIYLEGVNADYDKLRADPKAWAEFKAECALWDSTNLDGLEDK